MSDKTSWDRPAWGGTKEELKRLRSIPRVIKTKNIPWHGGPQAWVKSLVMPEDNSIKSVYSFMEDMAPGGKSQKHGHQNEAVFYILEGRGHEIHDEKRYDWEAGDAVIVHAGCVHQHFNDDQNKNARALVLNAKALYLTLQLYFQDTVEKAPSEPSPTGKEYQPKD